MPIYSDININLEKQTDGDVKRDDEYVAISNSISNIFLTYKGERRMLPTFGSNLNQYIFEPLDENTAYEIGAEILNALTYWEKRINILEIRVIPKYDSNLFDITVVYNIKSNPQITKEFNYILKRS